MNTRGIGLAFLFLCVLGGLIAALFTPAIAATLTLPGAGRATGPAQAQPTPSATGSISEPTAPATTVSAGVTVLARDTFQRPDQPLWGTSSDSRIWGGDANTNPAFSIVDHAGQVTGGQGPYQGVLNVTSADAELLVSGTVSRFDADGDINMGGILRWQDANNWYKALINGSLLELFKDVNGTMTMIGSQPFEAVGGVQYSLRFRVLGSNLFARAWPSSQAEPADWMLTVIDTQLVSGASGIRVWVAPGAIIRITSFLETSVPDTM